MYNSECFVGYVILFGKNIKKCVRYVVKGKRCRICDVVKENRVCFRKYDCLWNWFGFVKVMELVMVCEMI